MLYIHNPHTSPYFNLAAEEYILKEFNEDCFMLWQDEPSIIVGKNQNTLSEINVEYVEKHHIPVVRRLSGGGATFHDLGNLNFTFIDMKGEGSLHNFKKFTLPILEVLHELSIPAEFSGRNDLTIEGKKFSGNAQYHYKDRILHHGTLLFSSNMTDLSAALKVKPLKFQDKSIKSISSRVTNISNYLKEPLTLDTFKEHITKHVLSQKEAHSFYEFTAKDLEKINTLVKEKYSTWEWNFGRSPKYSFQNEKRLPCGSVEVHLDVKEGTIQKAKIFGDFFGKQDIAPIENALIGLAHKRDEIEDALRDFVIEHYFANSTLEEIVSCMF